MSDTPLRDFFTAARGNFAAFRYYARLARIQAWLFEHYAEDASIPAAARVAGLNPKYFSRYFRAKTGVRYSDWVNAVRIDRATRLLRQSNRSVTSVGYEVGYKDLRTFQRAFKKYAGTTPRKYRDAARPKTELRGHVPQPQSLHQEGAI